MATLREALSLNPHQPDDDDDQLEDDVSSGAGDDLDDDDQPSPAPSSAASWRLGVTWLEGGAIVSAGALAFVLSKGMVSSLKKRLICVALAVLAIYLLTRLL